MLYGSCENAIRQLGYVPDEDGIKRCQYCGCIDPELLCKLITEGKATLSGSDWKYGYPHKFYVKIVNPHPDKQYKLVSGTDSQGRAMTQYGKRSFLFSKFYTSHLSLLSEEDFNRLIPIINEACGIKFYKGEDGKIQYEAPYFDYQRED